MNKNKNLVRIFSLSLSPIESAKQFNLDNFIHNEDIENPIASYYHLKRKNITNIKKPFLLRLKQQNKENSFEKSEFIRRWLNNNEENDLNLEDLENLDDLENFKKIRAKNLLFFDLSEFNKKIAVLGTYHRSELSSLQCLQVIRTFNPETIVIETEYLRYEQLRKSFDRKESEKFLANLQIDFLSNKKSSFPKRLSFYLSSGLETLTTLSLLPSLPSSPSIIAEDLPASESVNKLRSSQILCKCPNEIKMSLISLSIKLIFLGLKNLFFRKTLRKCGEGGGMKGWGVAQKKAREKLDEGGGRRGNGEGEVGGATSGFFENEKERKRKSYDYYEKKREGGGMEGWELAQKKGQEKLDGVDGKVGEGGGKGGRGKRDFFEDEEDLRKELGLETENDFQIDFERDPDCLDVETLEKMQMLVDEFVIKNKNCVQMKTSYERDEKMFENALFASTGEKVLVIVGMMHLDGWRYMVDQLSKNEEEGRREEEKKEEKKEKKGRMEEKNKDEEERREMERREEEKDKEGWQDVVRRMEEVERRRKEVMRNVSRSTTMKFCHEKTCKT